MPLKCVELGQWLLLGYYSIISSAGSLRRSLVKKRCSTQTWPTSLDNAVELSLYSKLGKVIAPKLGQGTTTSDDSKVRQRTEGNCHSKVPFDNPTLGSRWTTWWAGYQPLRAWLGQHPTHWRSSPRTTPIAFLTVIVLQLGPSTNIF